MKLMCGARLCRQMSPIEPLVRGRLAPLPSPPSTPVQRLGASPSLPSSRKVSSAVADPPALRQLADRSTMGHIAAKVQGYVQIIDELRVRRPSRAA